MTAGGVLVLGAREVSALLAGAEGDVVAAVRAAYAAHGRGDSVLPHSSFVKLPRGADRIIALPAYLGGGFEVAGVKWIASFPDNPGRGLERASGLVVLSCTRTGRPFAVLEGSVVSAKRTAASAALAVGLLHGAPAAAVGVIGCGTINLEVVRFVRHLWPSLARVVAHDSHVERSRRFAVRGRAELGVDVEVAADPSGVFAAAPLVSIATTAATPWLRALPAGAARTLLHLSLRDLSPEIVLAADNVVDDVAHVCRAETSLHLAERQVGHRRFIRAALPALLDGADPRDGAYGGPTIFSPFGLGVLDIAVAQLVWERAEARGVGTRLAFSSPAAV